MPPRDVIDLDIEGLADRYVELHKLPPSDRRREYWRGRVDEYVAQNAVSAKDQLSARAVALSRIEAERGH